MEKKFVEQMDRIEVIEEIRSLATPTWFHSLLSWTTPRLKALLVFYREDAKEGRVGLPEDKSPISEMFGEIAESVR